MNNRIDVKLSDADYSLRLQTNFDWFYQLSGYRVVYSEYKMLLSYLNKFDGKIIFPFTGNVPIVPACLAQLNPASEIKVYESDAHDFRMMSNSLKNFKNIQVCLASDGELEQGEKPCLAVVTILNNMDRLFSFDVIEKLNEMLPDKSEVYILIQRKRQSDFMKKLPKEFTGGNIIDKCREAILYKCKTSKEKNRWSNREKVVDVDAIGAKIKMVTRPGVFNHGKVDAGGLALYDSVELEGDEKVLELGCGAGLISLLLAEKSKAAGKGKKPYFQLVDSSKRAIDCCLKNVALNQLENIECELTDLFTTDKKFDVFIGNPPYYANHRIADYFVKTAAAVLKKSGRLYLVSKHQDEMDAICRKYGFKADHHNRRGYTISIGYFS